MEIKLTVLLTKENSNTKYLKLILLFWGLSVSTCGIAQTVGNDNEISNSFNITNITKVIQRLDDKTIKEINKISDVDEKTGMLLSFMDTLQLQVSNLRILLEKNNTKDNIINQLIEERQHFIQMIDTLILTLNQQRKIIDAQNAQFNPKSLIPGWVQNDRGDKRNMHLFIWSEVVLIPSAAVSWSQYCKYKDLSKNSGRNQNVYETNRDICLGLGIGTTALAVGFYIWNIIDGNTNKGNNTNKDKKGAFIPYATPNEYGIAFLLKF